MSQIGPEIASLFDIAQQSVKPRASRRLGVILNNQRITRLANLRHDGRLLDALVRSPSSVPEIGLHQSSNAWRALARSS